MSKSTRGARVAGIASLAVTLSIGVAAPAFAVDGFELTRLAGDDRYETAAEVGDEYGAKPDAIIANGQPGEFADALAGNYLAGAADAPILLTKRSGLPGATTAQLEQQNVENVWVLGGTAAVPQEQVDQLEADGYNVTRIAGDNRYDTNAEVLAEGGAATDGVGLIATGRNFPDALAAGPFAYQGHSLGLVQTDSVPDAVGDALEADGVEQVLIFGGTDVVGPGVEADLAARGIEVLERFAGADRSETSEIAADWAVENLDFSDAHLGVASGYSDGWGADALAGGPLEGKEMAPMLITRNVDNPDDVLDYIEAHNDTLTDGHIYGGTAAISAAAEAAMEAAGQGDEPASNQDFTVTPQESATLTAVANPEVPADNKDDRQYTVTGLENGVTYTIQLFPADNVTTTDNVTTFKESGTSNTADEGSVAADITVVNGTVVAAADDDATAQAVNGQITFTVDGDTPETIVPVVYQDADSDGNVDLDADNKPTEAFGVGGVTRYVPAEGEAGDPAADETITEVDKAADEFFTANGLYEYDANDRFFIDAQPDGTCSPTEEVTFNKFESELSVGDELLDDTSYQPEDSLSSTFCIEDAAPGAPTVAATGGQGEVDVDITLPANFDNDDTITLQRATTQPGADTVCVDDPATGAVDEEADNTVGTYATVATLTKADDEDTTSANVIDYTDAVDPGCYTYRATATLDGETSGNSNEDTAESTADSTNPSMSSATANDVNDGIGSTNQVIVTFSEAVTVLDNSKITVHPAGQPGLVFNVTSSQPANASGTQWRLTLSGTLNDASSDVTYQVDSAAGAYEDNAGNDNVAEDPDTTFAY